MFFINICCVSILIGLAISQAPLTTEEAAEIKAKIVADCRGKHKNLTNAELDDILVKRILSSTRTGDCFVACILKGREFMAPNNTILEENIRLRLDRTKDQAPPEEYPKKVKVLEHCKAKETKEADECVASHNFISCINEQKTEYGVTTRMW